MRLAGIEPAQSPWEGEVITIRPKPLDCHENLVNADALPGNRTQVYSLATNRSATKLAAHHQHDLLRNLLFKKIIESQIQ